MATFHPFPRLPPEIRIQIWESAIVEGRVLRVKELRSRTAYWSPTPVPAVTRACRESRKYCSYKKVFIVDGSPRYVWADFKSDVIQMNSACMGELADGQRLEKKQVRHLRIGLLHDSGWDQSEYFFYTNSGKIRHFPKLERCDVLVNDGLYVWGNFIKEMYWGAACPKNNVRVIDAKTGEFLNAKTAGPYQDYLDTSYGRTKEFIREDSDWDDEDADERYEVMMKEMKTPLPRINLDY